MRYLGHLSFITNDETDDHHKMSKSPRRSQKIKTARHQCWNGSLNTSNVQRIFISISIIYSDCFRYHSMKLAPKRGRQVNHQKKSSNFLLSSMVVHPGNHKWMVRGFLENPSLSGQRYSTLGISFPANLLQENTNP